jgi:hypothetical protein
MNHKTSSGRDSKTLTSLRSGDFFHQKTKGGIRALGSTTQDQFARNTFSITFICS